MSKICIKYGHGRMSNINDLISKNTNFQIVGIPYNADYILVNMIIDDRIVCFGDAVIDYVKSRRKVIVIFGAKKLPLPEARSKQAFYMELDDNNDVIPDQPEFKRLIKVITSDNIDQYCVRNHVDHRRGIITDTVIRLPPIVIEKVTEKVKEKTTDELINEFLNF